MRRFALLVLLAGIVAVPAAAAPVRAKLLMRSTAVGSALVDARGHALYLYAADTSRSSTCYGACAASWPPFLTSARPLAGTGVKASLLGTTKRKDGRLQVTYGGHPLYFFANDLRAGQVNGQGTNSRWWVIAPTGKKILKDAAPPPGYTTGGGY
jgi:predicted lipoprotein with Yx(FWY)xxD motif